MPIEMLAQGLLVERIDAKAKVVHVASLAPGPSAACPSQLAANIDEVDERPPGPQLVQPDIGVGTLQQAAQYLAVKTHHGANVTGADNDVVDASNAEWCRHWHSPREVAGPRQQHVRDYPVVVNAPRSGIQGSLASALFHHQLNYAVCIRTKQSVAHIQT
jgi:hypothetical protein